MKVLIGIDDSLFSQAAVEQVAQRPWPRGTQVRLLAAVEPHFTSGYGGREEVNVYEQARRAVDRAVDTLQSGSNEFDITTEIVEGSPKQAILDEAERWGAELIVVGSHGRRGLQRFLLGSVSQAVALHAKCSVEIVRVPAVKAA
ncbi:MAG TPA: universal stress protein [Blastocatellia bacterium]|nr:universal stress protein [Blastocatellia bacterium]